jgi:hypothetical protein
MTHVTAPAPTTSAAPAKIGPNPFVNVLSTSLVVVIVSAAVLAFMFMSKSKALIMVATLGIFAWILLAIVMVVLTLASLANTSTYVRAKRAVTTGAIRPDWVVRGTVCNGIALVDEGNRKIFVNDGVYDFDDVKELAWRIVPNRKVMNFFLDFTMRAGTAPHKRVQLDTEAQLMQAHARLTNVLGME